MEKVTVFDKTFEISIPHEAILERVAKLAEQMNEDLKDKEVIFLGILNGSFMFASDLYKQIKIPSLISFLKLASYTGTSTTGKVKRLIGINEDIANKTVVIIEDIVDTGITLEQIIKQLRGYDPADIKVATLLFKPEAYQKDFDIDYIGFSIPPEFIIGYGLDYDGLARNLPHIYKLV
ncbi:MAG: hypoxanthine phosphoribosyltransferase [Salinivirgaceae bacterium]|nr:MAG: hypoxanthine phosphoribosyltransferase [Salinivirgaceae bacterium]